MTSFVDGDDLLALVNRSPAGALSPDWAPSDLVDLATGKPRAASECDAVQCLRRETATALHELLGAMRKAGYPGKVESAFRSYGAQCGTFLRWANKGSFCDATEQSALPGHSQHQLGTTLDLFTEAWAKDPRGVFRSGFGCSPGGRFLQEHATDYGFVFPYPIHPDDRHPKDACRTRTDIQVFIHPKTGYRYEHWHLRYIGKESAAAFRAAFEASGPGTPGELTLEQWLREKAGLTGGDIDLPVCDGCNCGACATLAAPGRGVCDRNPVHPGLHLDALGEPALGPDVPTLTEVALLGAERPAKRPTSGGTATTVPVREVVVSVEVPTMLATAPPIVGRQAASYAQGTYEALSPYPNTEPRRFEPLPNAWVIALEPSPNTTGTAWPWRAALTSDDVGLIYNRANVLLPARAGTYSVRVTIPAPSAPVRVKATLLRGGVPQGEAIEISDGAPSYRRASPPSTTPGVRSPAPP